jgi:hypothetical protein
MRKRLRFDAVEVVLLVSFAIVVTRFAVQRHDIGYGGASLVEAPLPQQLERRYGGKRYSMGLEEWFVRDFFGDLRGGVFVDVGAWHPTNGSNTYRLERDLGWSGLAVDALQEWAEAYEVQRPRSRFVVAFVSDQDSGAATLNVPRTLTEVASSSKSFVSIFAEDSTPRQVRRRTLDSLLEQSAISRIDFMSMDIELGEPAALRAFDIARFRPALVCVEAHGETRQEILDYFAAHGYVLMGKYMPHDRVNLYFAPLARSADVSRPEP